MTFPAQPVGDPSASQTFYISNFGNNTIIIDRAITTGDFEINEDGSNCEAATLGTCLLNVELHALGVGARTGS